MTVTDGSSTPFQLVPRAGAARRCAYCHDALGAERVVSCAACGSTLHAPCARLLRRCPSLGCTGALADAPSSATACATHEDRPLGPLGRLLFTAVTELLRGR